MKLLPPALLSLTLVASPAFAQSQNTNGNTSGVAGAGNNGGQVPSNGRNATGDWSALIALTVRVPPATVGRKNAAQKALEDQQKAQQSREAAAAARVFYTSYPTDPNAGLARKIEVRQSLLGVVNGESAQEASAQQIAAAYRSDLTNALDDRFEVALFAETVANRAKLKGGIDTQNASEREKIADKLRLEFGDIPAIHNLHASIARGADMATARRIAGNLMQSASASAEAKDEARAILARDALLTKSLSVKLTALDGLSVDLSQPNGRTTVLYVCTYGIGNTHQLSALRAAANTLPAGVQVIYLVLGANAEQAATIRSLAPTPGVFCSDVLKSESSAMHKLLVRRTPYVFVLNPAGILTGFGPVAELSNLLAVGR